MYALGHPMPASDHTKPSIIWKGLDSGGYFRGVYRDGEQLFPISIAVPGEGDPPHAGPLFQVFIRGEKAGSMPNLKGAQALAELHVLGFPRSRKSPGHRR